MVLSSLFHLLADERCCSLTAGAATGDFVSEDNAITIFKCGGKMVLVERSRELDCIY